MFRVGRFAMQAGEGKARQAGKASRWFPGRFGILCFFLSGEGRMLATRRSFAVANRRSLAQRRLINLVTKTT